MIKSNKFCFLALFLCLSAIFVPSFKHFSQGTFKFKTSVWCFKNSHQATVCRFKNICYDSNFKTFIFFLAEDSIISGLNHYNELKNIQLSSVKEHNQFFANLSVVEVQHFKPPNQFEIYSKALLFSRFKPNNIMHTIHDDLFPIYLTLEFICFGNPQCMESYGLLLHDNYFKGPFFNLYAVFSNQSPILLTQLELNSTLCFEEILTGLMTDSVVYQYGFNKPHGSVKPYHLTQNDVSRFTKFVKNKLQIQNKRTNISEVVLFRRLKNRKILNVDELHKMIKNTYEKFNKNIQLKIINLDLFSNNLKTLISVVSQANALIGMHGAEMIFSLFLKPQSHVFEIFPFGINPDIVSFIKPFSELDDSNFRYFSWTNTAKNNSVPHPDAHPLFGGIFHLDKTTQQKIQNALEVPPVKCCNDPLFLYYMYQDTLISNEFESFLIQSLAQTYSGEPGKFIDKWFYPYKVYNVTCHFQPHKRLLNIKWSPPFNTANKNLMYSLYIRDRKHYFSKNISTEKTALEIEIAVEESPKFEMWILAYFQNNNFVGPDLYINCY